MVVKTGQWALVLCAILICGCDGRFLGFGSGSSSRRGITEEPDAGLPVTAARDAGPAPEVASGVDALNEPHVDSGGSSDGGASFEGTPVSCAGLPAGIFPPNGVTCQLVDPQADRLCVPDPFYYDGRKYLDFVGCIQGAPTAMGAVCANGMCCHALLTSFLTTPGYVCGITSGMQIVAYGKALDTDQDLIPDLQDNCPYVDNTFQQDDDGDGIGNACDPCPEVPGVDCADAGAPSGVSCADIPTGIFPSGSLACQPIDPQAGLSGKPFCIPPLVGADGPLKLDFVGCKHGAPATTGGACSNGICCYWLQPTTYSGAPGDACAYPGGMDLVAYGKAQDTDQDSIPDYWDNCPYAANPLGQDDDNDGVGNACDPCPEVFGVSCADAGVP
jgi:hypothetical protein